MREVDGDRLCWGTLTRLPVRPPDVIDQRVASGAMLSAPLVGATLGVVAGALAWGVWAVHSDALGALLGSVLAFAFLAWATRAIHLDGLADTADALGSGKPPEQALEIARKSDIGPFGVITVVLVLGIDVIALAMCIESGIAMFAAVVALISSRLVLTLGCMRGIRAARRDGLGFTVANSVHPGAAAAVVVGWTLIIAFIAAAMTNPNPLPLIISSLAALFAGLACGLVVWLIARRRLGGITGDVLGAMVEIATAGALVTLALT